jgi:hypothetical protein
VEPTNVPSGGGAFLIHGTQMHPGIVSNVLLDRDALSTANYVPINDTESRVVVPGSQNPRPTPVQVNTTLQGKPMHSNNDVTVIVE